MESPDLFVVFRTTLFFVLTVYTLVTTATAGWHVLRLLRGDTSRHRLLRTYLGYQLLSVRLEPLRGELLQIALWLTMLGVLWWLHGVV